MKKVIIMVICLTLALAVNCASLGESNITRLPSSGRIVGIAWRADTDNEFCTNVIKAVEAVGGVPVILEQVRSADLGYDENGKLTEGVNALGALTEEAGKLVRINTWYGSNALKSSGKLTRSFLPAARISALP